MENKAPLACCAQGQRVPETLFHIFTERMTIKDTALFAFCVYRMTWQQTLTLKIRDYKRVDVVTDTKFSSSKAYNFSFVEQSIKIKNLFIQIFFGQKLIMKYADEMMAEILFALPQSAKFRFIFLSPP